MASLQIRNVPADVHEALVRQAEAAGRSLQQHLAEQLAAIASRPTAAQVVARIESRKLVHLEAAEVVDAIEEGRARR